MSGSRVQSLTEFETTLKTRLDRAVRSEAPDWSLSHVSETSGQQIYRWTKNGDPRRLQALVRTFVNYLDADAAFAETVGLLSVGGRVLENVGDAAVQAGVPGGFQNLYIRIDNLVIHLRVPASIPSQQRLALAVVQQLR
jgi:hypothetical protein